MRLFARTFLFASSTCLIVASRSGAAEISYNRDVRPILAENCFACHGPDQRQRKAGLALHQEASATKPLESGATAVVPGKPDESELIKRILSEDADERMPPEKTGKHLTPAQVATLKAWIAQGPTWQAHWSYIPPQAATPPQVDGDRWSRGDIDRFLLARLKREGLAPSPQADPVTLIRRLSFDLVGLPPTPEEVDAFAADPSDAAYERAVDRLLASPHYGERMAVMWLDLVRYADTIGYHSDNPRNVVPYRDWVVKSFNDDQPFDRFTIEQLAGDLLPDATQEQKVASGYNRLLETTEEGGAQPKEYEAKNAADRVRNVSSAWLGSTMACCECHDHKYDPFSTRDFYSMAAFFADVQEAAIGGREPGMLVPDAAQAAELAKSDADLAATRQELDTTTPEIAAAQAEWEQSLAGYQPPKLGPWSSIGPYKAASAKEAFDTAYGPEKGDFTGPYAEGPDWHAHPEWKDAEVHNLTGDNCATYVYRVIESANADSLKLSLGSDDTITVWINGKQALAKEAYRGVAPDQDQVTIELAPGSNALLMKICNGGGGYAFWFKALTAVPPEVVAAIAVPAGERSDPQRALIAKHYRTIAPLLAPTRERLAALEKGRKELETRIPRCLVSTSGAPRVVRIKRRGDWMDEGGDVVEPAVPHFLKQIVRDGRATRLDLALWLVSRDQPLTARVFVNRLWRLAFGVGLSRTVEDLGTQGEWPVHPELLDWLAVDFMEHGWDVKRALKQIVMSSAYRQASHAGALAERDPDNRLIARQSRFRLDAEFVRDDALAIAGLLTPTVGGGTAKPYQPAGYWMHLNFPPREWKADSGENQYRRGLYTFWCRTFLQPSLLAFDAPSREVCVAERPRSDTPLQALALLNDPSYVEAARAFAERVIAAGDATDARVRAAYRLALSRAPLADETAVLTHLHDERLAAYQADPEAAKKLLAVGQHATPADADVAELAAWTSVARAILNLHETITRY